MARSLAACVFGVPCALLFASYVGLVSTESVPLTNDYPSALRVSCDGGDFVVRPGRSATIPISALDPVPCTVATGRHDYYIGCLADYPNAPGGWGVTRLSQVVRALTIDECGVLYGR